MIDIGLIVLTVLAILLLLPLVLITLLLLLLTALTPLILAVLLVYVLILVRPQGKKPPDERLLCPYAHRGLHGDGAPENSLEAFRRACDAGYGIELDVQTTRDGVVVVFHDDNLSRMTGKDALLTDLTLAELKALRLDGTEEIIPTLEEVLTLVGGRVPLLVELKGETKDTSLCAPVAAILQSYDGPYCVESFNPLLVRDMGRLIPEVYRGLLYTNVFRGKNEHPFVNFLLVTMLTNCMVKPNFIACNKLDRGSPAVRLTTRLYHAPRFVWTVKTADEWQEAQARGEYPIFEQIRPR